MDLEQTAAGTVEPLCRDGEGSRSVDLELVVELAAKRGRELEERPTTLERPCDDR
jgi:hypothetical protein